MDNTTISLHDGDDIVSWVVVSIILGTLLYMTAALFVWPYARPIVAPWIILLCILIPPFFPVLLFFIVASFFSVPRTPPVSEVIVVETSRRADVPPPRPVPRRIMGGSRV